MYNSDLPISQNIFSNNNAGFGGAIRYTELYPSKLFDLKLDAEVPSTMDSCGSFLEN